MLRLLFLVIYILPFIGNSQIADSSIFIKQLDSQIAIVVMLIDQTKYDLASKLNDKLDSIANQTLGSKSIYYGRCLYNKARINYFNKQYKKANAEFEIAKLIFKNAVGVFHSDYLKTLYGIGLLYRETGDYSLAENTFLELEELFSKSTSKQDSQYLECRNALGLVYKDMQKYKKSESIFLEVKRLQEHHLGKNHRNLANTINNLAVLYKNMGQYDLALVNYLDVLKIREIVLGKQHWIYTSSLMNIAGFYSEIGDYELAETYYLEAITLRESAHGTNHPYYATSLEHLAKLYKEMHIYDKAIALNIQANEIRSIRLGKMHPIYALGLCNLANLYMELGEYNKALNLYLEAIAVYEKNPEVDQSNYLDCLNRLATLYIYIGNYGKSRFVFKQALNLYDSTSGRQNTKYAECLSNLANLYNEMGLCDSSEFQLLNALEILQQVLGQQHYKCANVMYNIAMLNKDIGNFERADSFFIASKSIREKVLGKNHVLYAMSLDQLGGFYEFQKKYTESEPILKELCQIDQARLQNASSFLSEVEHFSYKTSFQARSEKLGAYILSRQNNKIAPNNLSNLVYDNVIFSKGFLLAAMVKLNQLADSNTQTAHYLTKLKQVRRQLAIEYAKPKSEQKRVANLEAKANTNEKRLRKLIKSYSESKQIVKWQDIRDNLKKNEAAIEFIQFQFTTSLNQVCQMYAVVLLKSEFKAPKFIALCKESDLDSLLKSNFDHGEEFINAIYKLHPRGVTEVKLLNRSLYELIWKPLEKELTDVATIYFSPVGLIHRLNLNAIRITDRSILSDQFDFIELISTRQLAIPSQQKIINNEALLYGGLIYNSKQTALDSLSFTNVLQTNGTDTIWRSSIKAGSWDFLSGTEQEVLSIKAIMEQAGVHVTLKSGYEGTEESFKKILNQNRNSPRILSIATHGFFYPHRKIVDESRTLISTDDLKVPQFIISEQPMLRSGLIMAGANDAWGGQKIPEGKEDGILTAYEISQMTLTNTELVVLSACETGLGDIQGNEGVYGLQRAFKMAGAKYLIMSLWKIPDQETSEFMISFYKNWLELKLSIPQAFRQTQKAMKNRFIRPYQWAGFILIE